MTGSPAALATIVVSPRDSFTNSLRCLRRLLECTPAPRRIVYVDGGSPAPVARELEACAVAEDFALLRTDEVLSPNRARNLALEHIPAEDAPPWVAFVDNDAYVEPEWLTRLRACGDETGAVAVVPLLCLGEPGRERIHVAGGDATIVDDKAGRRFEETHPLAEQPVHAARDGLVRRQCGMFEFHAVLVDAQRLGEVAPLDEGLLSLLEHVDLGFDLQADGGEIWFEPAVEVTYLPGSVRERDARRYFVTRWSDEWNEASVRRFREKRRLPADDDKTDQNVEFGAWLRARAYLPYRSPLVRWARRKDERYPRSVIDRLAQRDASRWYARLVAAAGPPRLVHRPDWVKDVSIDA
jgi:GT2 family glycosyltransferase